jgi:serine/threonine protein phosphatase PrpC
MEARSIHLSTGPADATSDNVLHWVSASATHVGKVRKLNEDALLEYPQIGLWAVADGVGGASAGDWASAFTVQSLGRTAKPETMASFVAEISVRLGTINDALREQAESAARQAIATTVVALLFFDQKFACAWAGDSRLYLFRQGRLRQVNHDHSEVQEMVDRGLLGPAEARHHPLGNIVTRAVGAFEKLDLEVVEDQLLADDIFLLCSDGLTKTAEDAEIAALLSQPIEEAVSALITLALDRGAPDNVTVITVKVLGADDGRREAGLK